LDEAEGGDLEDVVEGLAGPLVAGRQLTGEREEPLHDGVTMDRVARVAEAGEQAAVGELPLVARSHRLSGSVPSHGSPEVESKARAGPDADGADSGASLVLWTAATEAP